MRASVVGSNPDKLNHLDDAPNLARSTPRAGCAILAFMEKLFTFPSAVARDPEVEAWLEATDPLRALARPWFERMRACGPDVRELMHDKMPTACAGEAAFGYVNAFKAHANVGFFFGAVLDDPEGLLEGTGKRMRHVKLRPGPDGRAAVDADALGALIASAYADIQSRLAGR